MSKDKAKEVQIEVTSAFVYDGKVLKPGQKTKVLASDAKSFASRGKCLMVGGGAVSDQKAAKAGDGETDK